MIFMNAVTIDSMGRKVQSSDSEPRKCERTWWKLEGKERKKHVDLMRIQLLSPFLFSKVYQDETWVEWAKSSRLLSQKRMGAMDDLSVEEFENTDLVEVAINNLQEEIDQHHRFNANNKDVQFLEELLNSIGSCKRITNLDDALERVRNTSWFRAVRTQVEKISISASQNLKKDAAVFLAAWQINSYMMAVYGGDKPLDTYMEDSTLDSTMEKSKNEGNKFYTNAEFSKAISKYTQILYAKPYLHIVYGNRAACYLKKEEYRSALSDGRRATTLNHQWEKGQYRYAQAFYELGHKEDALKVLSNALKLCGKNIELSSYRKKIRSELNSLKQKSNDPDDSENDEDDSENEDFIDDDLPDLDYEVPDDDDSDSSGMPALVTDSDSDSGSDNGINECSKRVLKKKEKGKKKKSNDSTEKKTSSLKNKQSNDKTSTQNETKKDSVDETKDKESVTRQQTKKKKGKPTPAPQTIDPVVQMKTDLSTAMKEGSLALLEKRGRNAIYEYSKAFHLLEDKKGDLLNMIGSMEYLVLHYANGVAHSEAGSYLDLVESIRIFGEINIKFADKKFPLSYLGIGKVYILQNRFHQALYPLNQALMNESSVVKLTWPGMDTIIEETKPGVLKDRINALLAQCVNPPRPDATCRYTECKQSRKVMYFSDPDFKGFVRLICTDSCFVEFHACCWKRYRSHNTIRTSEKDYLNDECLTPDCVGNVDKVEIFEDGSMTAKTDFVSEKQKEIKQPYVDKKKRMKPSSERGYEKKLQKYKEKLKRKEQKDFGNDDVDVIDEILAADSQNDSSKGTPKIKDDSVNVTSDLPLEGEMYELRNKDDQDMLFQGGKSKKTKAKKTPKPKITLDIPFIERDKSTYGSDVSSFQPEDLKVQIAAFEEAWGRNINSGFSPYIIDNSESIVDGFDFGVYKSVVVEPKKVALHIYSMFEQILEATGCGDVHNSKDILEFYNILDDSSKLLIQTVGGLRTFLSKCNRFSFDQKNRNVVYLTSQESFYHLGRDSAFKYKDTYSPPECEDPLFVNKLDFHDVEGITTDIMNPKAEPFVPTTSESVIGNNDIVNEIVDNNSDRRVNNMELDEKPSVDEKPSGTLTEPVNSEIEQLGGSFGNVDGCISKPADKLKHISVSDEIDRISSTSVKEDLEAVIANKIDNEKTDLNFNDEASKTEIILSKEKEKVEQKMTKLGSFLDDETAEIVEFTKTTYPKRNSGFQLSESIDYGVIQDSRREDVNMTVFENSDNNCKVCIITEKGFEHKNLDTFKKVFGGENVRELEKKKESPKKVKDGKKSITANKTKPEKDYITPNENKNSIECSSTEVIVKTEKPYDGPLCVGEAGVQTDMIKEERNELSGKCENLRKLNITLMNERKKMQEKEEKLQDELQKQKNRFLLANEKLQSELGDQKKTIEKMRKESMRTNQTNECEIKKHITEKKELNGTLKSLQKKFDEASSHEKTFQKNIEQKDAEITELKRMIADVKRIREREKRELEEIIEGITNSQLHQSQRAQKVEIALLEVKKEVVIKKYREQAIVIQNTLNQMQFWPNIPEAQNIRSIWEDYKKKFQLTYQKMQEEFIELIRAVKDGQPLETMPPAKYAEPPPYPNVPTLNMNPHGLGPPIQPPRQEQLMLPTQRTPAGASLPPLNHIQHNNIQHNNRQPQPPPPVAPSVDSHEQTPNSNGSNYTNGSSSNATAGHDSDSDESFGSSSNKSNEEPKLPIKMLDRVILRLASSFPNYSRHQLQFLVTDFRRQQGSMSGMTFEEIIFGIEHWVKTGRFHPKNQSAHASQQPLSVQRQPVDPSKGKKITKPTTGNPVSAQQRARATHLTVGNPYRPDQPNGSWLENPALPIRHHDGFDQDDGCIICFEDMTEVTALKLHCGHVFHKNCISCWLNEQRTCPICRVHALLPEEYPALKTVKLPH